VIFDLLTKPDVVLTKQETAKVKKVARTLLEKLKKEKLVLDWRKQQATRAMVFTTVKESAGCSPAEPASVSPNRSPFCATVVLPVEYFLSNGRQCLNCLSHLRGPPHIATKYRG